MRTTQLARAGALILAATTVMVVAPQSPASAETCGDDGTTKLFDPSGSYFDFTDAGLTADRDEPFAAFYDSGTNGPGDTPPGPRSNTDTFDDWGGLFVGGTTVADMYFSADNNACSTEEGGAENVYPIVTLHGLQVQRKIYVRPSTETGGLPGARVLDLLTNSGATPITTSVQVGDHLSTDDQGDVGSDEDTAVRSSSSGDAVAAAGDTWFVTSDHRNDSGTSNSDPAIGFVVDGPGAIDPASLVQVGGGSDTSPQDNIFWRHDLTIAPGETVALMSFVVQGEAAAGPTQAAQADALAASRAQAYQTAPAAQLYAGMSAAEIAALRNWNDFEVTGELTAAKKQKLRKKFAVKVTCPEEACEADLKGTLRVGKKSFKLKRAVKQAAAGVSTPVKLKLSKKTFAKVLAMLADNPALAKKVKVKFTGTVSDLTDTAQQKVSAKSKVKIKL